MDSGNKTQGRAIPFLELEEDDNKNIKFTINPEAE